ncbi:biopolymer transport protein TolR [Rhodoligotrophos appendicifer]|uniref:protein TolR n=1 Tax=Rhodoligotrophos appendicifer TaxID=987056 RepID=UPI0011871451|nr:protein TolR [Rhodoligotrophos appendicifer]
MGASLQTNNSGGRRGGRRRRSSHAPMSEINVTPMVDVMLVLLIIFMVAAPLLTVGVPVELPESKGNPMEGDKEPLTVSVDGAGKIFLQDTEITLDTLVPKLEAITKQGYDERIYVRGDKAVDYGTVAQVMGSLSAAGFKRIGLVLEPAEDGS